jgi:recombinational DNA repair protein RecR
VKKGRHRRFEEARDLKRAVKTVETEVEPCAECGAEPGNEHASWCLAMEDDDDEEALEPTDSPGTDVRN